MIDGLRRQAPAHVWTLLAQAHLTPMGVEGGDSPGLERLWDRETPWQTLCVTWVKAPNMEPFTLPMAETPGQAQERMG